jgi:hypothetical protein
MIASACNTPLLLSGRLIRQTEAARAKRQAVDGAAWRYSLDRSAVRDETGNAFDKMIQRLSLRS